MTLGAPIAAKIGLNVGKLNPTAGLITGLAIEAAFGIIGGIYGEKAVTQTMKFFGH
ncbi:MAG: hypothetical protein IPK03_03175 [Bacteroidetes bacterium]|nr:hypothetical protein [Bacteroidota bacterium]